MTSLQQLLQAIRDQYPLAWDGLHGVTHWARVFENGLRLAPDTGADERVLLYFAIFHDACRVNDGWDTGHGRRGAELAFRLRGDLIDFDSEHFDLLYEACAHHTDGLIVADPRVQTCWDSDRLDLARAGIRPRPDRLCTEAARRPEVITWATERSLRRWAPPFRGDAWHTNPSPDRG